MNNNFVSRCFHAAGITLYVGKSRYARLVDKLDESQDTGYMFVGPLLDADAPPIDTRLIVCYAVDNHGNKCAGLVVTNGDYIVNAFGPVTGPNWAMQLKTIARARLAELAETGTFESLKDCNSEVTKIDESNGIPLRQPRPRQERKDVIDVIRECYEHCPDMTVWTLVRDSVGDQFDKPLTNDELMELIFNFTMQRESEELALA